MAGSIQSDVQTSSVSDCIITVVDENGDGIDGVLIEVQNSVLSETTDASGKATLTCEEDATFILSHDDYSTVEVPRDNESELTVVMTLKEDDQN